MTANFVLPSHHPSPLPFPHSPSYYQYIVTGEEWNPVIYLSAMAKAAIQSDHISRDIIEAQIIII